MHVSPNGCWLCRTAYTCLPRMGREQTTTTTTIPQTTTTYLGWRSQMAFLCTCTRHFLQVLPTGLWTLVARAGEAPVVPPGMPHSRRPLRRVEKASLMRLPCAPELQNVTPGQNMIPKCGILSLTVEPPQATNSLTKNTTSPSNIGLVKPEK